MDPTRTSSFDRSAIEVPFAPTELSRRMDDGERGQATEEVATTSEWAGVDLERARPHLLRVAAATLTDQQLAVFTRWVGGASVTGIGRELGISQQVVSKHLHGNGQAQDGSARGGALKKMKAALEADELYRASLEASKAHATDVDGMHVVREWFKPIRPNTLTHFVPFVVLLVIVAIADARRRTTFSALHAHILPTIVTNAMPVLKLRGYVRTDGVTIEVLKTPLEEP